MNPTLELPIAHTSLKISIIFIDPNGYAHGELSSKKERSKLIA
jgi:hypothetical protein